ncbi:MAG: RHS repeat protein [Runella slithyformis]|nr:MAG: RHS repeat protein [Runella slithyformis]TAF25134.1 MAG: RHS repeat protein [Runella slithyformis]
MARAFTLKHTLFLLLVSIPIFGQVAKPGVLPKDTAQIKALQNQINNFLPRPQPKNPEAAALGRFGSHPVQLSSGLPSIEIPLYDINVGSLRLPIALKYHASGIKVGDVASSVGLGWALEAGGRISRSTVGRDDELEYLTTGPRNYPNQPLFCNLTAELAIQAAAYDSGADVFNYQTPSGSGRFMLRPELNGQPQPAIILPDEPIRVSYQRNAPTGAIQSFAITQPDGTVHGFTARETSTASGSASLANGFLLTSITGSQPTEVIRLEYEQMPAYSHPYEATYSQSLTDEDIVSLGVGNLNTHPSSVSFDAQRLSVIYFPNGKVTFSYQSTDRLDLPNTRALNLVQLWAYQPATDDYGLVKQFDLVQDYFGSGNTARLRLAQVRLLDSNGGQIGRYAMGYNTTQNLPEVGSKARDFWGYYNGQDGNTTLLAQQNVVYSLSNGGFGSQPIGNANREVNLTTTPAWTLNQLTYPTDGYTTFDYENNQYLDQNLTLQWAGGLRIKTISTYASPAASPLLTSFRYGQNESGGGQAGFNTKFRFLSHTQYAWYEPPPDNVPARKRVRTFMSDFNSNLSPFEGSPVFYDVVTQYEGNPLNANGKTVHEFRYRSDGLLYPDQTFGLSGCNVGSNTPIPITPDLSGKQTLQSYHWDRGQPARTTTWGADGKKKREIVYTYTRLRDTQSPVVGMLLHKLVDFDGLYVVIDDNDCRCRLGNGQYVYKYYSLPLGISKQTRVEEFDYDDNDPAKYVYKKTETDYAPLYFQPKETRVFNSDGELRINRLRYVSDFDYLPNAQTDNAIALQMMRGNNQISTPVESISLRKNPNESQARVIGGQLSTFRVANFNLFYLPPFNTRTMPDAVFLLEVPAAPALDEANFVVSDVNANGQLVMDNRYALRLQYGDYDFLGNQTSYQLPADIPRFFSYSSPFKDGIHHSRVTSQSINGHATQFDFDYPLLGLRAITTPNQLSTRFEYDAFGRLKRSRDANQHLLAEYEYQYGAGNTFVRTYTPRVIMGNLYGDYAERQTNTQYFDGLGRPTQSVGYRAGFDAQNDIITNATTYDDLGRTDKVYRSFGYAGFGAQAPLPSSIDGDTAPFAQTTQYDNSPLNRPKTSFGVGQAWRNANKASQRRYEVANWGEVRQYITTANGVYIGGTWRGDALFKNVSVSEQGNQSIEYQDHAGKLIQKSVQAEGGNYLHTAYVYDDFDRLKYVIQPKAFENASNFAEGTTYFNEGVFAYRYDARGRVAESHVPGGSWTYRVYDRLDRVVLTQTELQRSNGRWRFGKYDGWGRATLQGELTNYGSRADLQTAFGNVNVAYDDDPNANASYPISYNESDVRQQTFYDNYQNWLPNGVGFDGGNAYHSSHYSATGMATGAKVRQGQNQNWLYSATYYDVKNRPIQTFAQNLYGQTERTDMEYNFAGEVLKMRQIHKDQNGNATTQVTENEYDHVGRKTNCYQTINGGTREKIATYSYDAIGRQSQKKIMPERTYQQYGSTPAYIYRPANPTANTQDIATQAIILQPTTTIDALSLGTYLAQIGQGTSLGTVQGLQTIDYQYHIRGYLKSVNHGQLSANQNDFFGNKLEFEDDGTYFDGNIRKETWKSVRNTGANRSYLYSYDQASRLISANYSGGNYSGENFGFSVSGYDKNGNILSLTRTGATALNSGIPTQFGTIDQMSYFYEGNRLTGITDAINGNTDVGDFRDNGTNLDYSYWPDGSLKSDGNRGISQIDWDSFLNKPKQINYADGRWTRFYYDGNGKKLRESTSTNDQTDYTDGAIYKNEGLYQLIQPEGRVVPNGSGGFKNQFDYVDPLATTYPHWTPYQYAGNMPINFVDLDGLEPAFYDPQSKNKVPAPISASDRLQQRMPQNATLAISTNRSLFPQNDKSDKIINGSINATMGVVGMIASTAYMVETVGAGAAVGGGAAFSLAFGETAIGLAQVADGLGNNGKTEILHNVSSTPGLVGASAGMSAENVGKLDAFSQLLPGLITGGNLVGIVQTPQKIRNASTTSERAFQTLNGVDALLDYTGAVKATQNDNNVSKSDQVTKTRANELINFMKKLPNEK